MDNIGEVGLIRVISKDTLSLLIKKITNDEWSFLGFYYKSGISSSKDTNLLLFNIYDGGTPLWTSKVSTLSNITNHSLISRIVLEPLKNNLAEKIRMAITSEISNSQKIQNFFPDMIPKGYSKVNNILEKVGVSSITKHPSGITIEMELPKKPDPVSERNIVDNTNMEEIKSLFDGFINCLTNNMTFREEFFNKQVVSEKTVITDIYIKLSQMSKYPTGLPLKSMISDVNSIAVQYGLEPIIIDDTWTIRQAEPSVTLKNSRRKFSIRLDSDNLSYLTEEELKQLIQIIDEMEDSRYHPLQKVALEELTKFVVL